MPRSSSSARSSYRKSRTTSPERSAPAAPATPATPSTRFVIPATPTTPSTSGAPAAPAAPAAPSQTVHHSMERPGLLSNIWQGFGLGAGQAIAHNIFRSSPEVKHIYESAPVAGGAAAVDRITFSKEYTQCMEESGQQKEACEHVLMK